MKLFSKTKFLTFTLVLAFLLRFYNLGSVPSSLNWDEVSNGYNAYSLLKTARDEYGTFLPLTNRSFDDYKPLLYMYLNIATVKFFGLSELAVRLPSAIFGTITVAIFYLLTRKLVSNKKISLIATFFIAVNPWNVHFSRVGFESNIGLFSGISALTALLYSLPNNIDIKKKHVLLLMLSAFLFALSFYTYHSARIFLPLMLLVTICVFWNKIILHSRKTLIAFIIIPIILIAPFFATAPREAISQRYKTVSLGAQKDSTDLYIKYVNQDNSSKASTIIHNRNLLIVRSYLSNYLSHFSPEFLFLTGDKNLRHHTEGGGMLPLFILPLALIGLYILVAKPSKKNLFIVSWLVVAPIPAAPADAAPHAVRSIFMTVPILFMASVGTAAILNLDKLKKYILSLILVLSMFFFLVTYLHAYYFHEINDKSEFWMYGFKQAVSKSMEIKDQYPVVNVDSSLEQGYVFWLFYNKYDPSAYQKNPSRPNVYNFSFNDNKVSEGELYVALADHYLSDLALVETIYYPNGKEAIKIGRKKYSWEK